MQAVFPTILVPLRRRFRAHAHLEEESPLMSNVCQVTGRRPSFGNNVSHSHRKTRRRWNPNIQRQRFYLPSEKRWITLTVSAKGIKTINKHGIERVVADMRRRGVKV
jgi:large subunit ribosomal protein L28